MFLGVYDKRILLNIVLSFASFTLTLYNMYYHNDYLVFVSTFTFFMYLGIGIWTPLEYKIWAVLFTLSSLIYIR